MPRFGSDVIASPWAASPEASAAGDRDPSTLLSGRGLSPQPSCSLPLSLGGACWGWGALSLSTLHQLPSQDPWGLLRRAFY